MALIYLIFPIYKNGAMQTKHAQHVLQNTAYSWRYERGQTECFRAKFEYVNICLKIWKFHRRKELIYIFISFQVNQSGFQNQ